METKVYTFYEQTIIDNIDFKGYGIDNEGYLYDKIKTLYNIFKKEYGFMIERVGEVNAFKEWLQGLPSVLTVPFMNSEILSIAKDNGFFTITRSTIYPDNTKTEEQVYAEGRALENMEDRFLNHYWTNLALAFFNLKDNL
jgi:hypothetical protein